MSRKSDTGVTFLCVCYSENETKRNLIGNALLRGESVVWCNHMGEDGDKDHTHAVVKVPFAQTISAFSKNHNFPDNLVQLCGRDREHTNAKGAIIYLVHQDNESLLQGKKQYDETSYKGPLADYAKKVLRQYLKKRKREDEDVTIILDFIDRQEHCSVASVVRWCCANNLYSVFRRSAATINNCIREHNSILHYADPDSVVLSRIREVEARLANSEKSLAYLRGVDQRRQRAEESAKVDMSIINDMLRKKGYYDG